jgi:hypothetical protein
VARASASNTRTHDRLRSVTSCLAGTTRRGRRRPRPRPRRARPVRPTCRAPPRTAAEIDCGQAWTQADPVQQRGAVGSKLVGLAPQPVAFGLAASQRLDESGVDTRIGGGALPFGHRLTRQPVGIRPSACRRERREAPGRREREPLRHAPSSRTAKGRPDEHGEQSSRSSCHLDRSRPRERRRLDARCEGPTAHSVSPASIATNAASKTSLSRWPERTRAARPTTDPADRDPASEDTDGKLQRAACRCGGPRAWAGVGR